MMFEAAQMEDYLLVRGDEFKPSWAMYNDKAMTVPMNLSQFTEIKLDVRSGPASSNPVIISGSITGGEITVTDNTIDADLGALDKSSGRYYYDLRFQNSDGEISTPFWGYVIIRENYTSYGD